MSWVFNKSDLTATHVPIFVQAITTEITTSRLDGSLSQPAALSDFVKLTACADADDNLNNSILQALTLLALDFNTTEAKRKHVDIATLALRANMLITPTFYTVLICWLK